MPRVHLGLAPGEDLLDVLGLYGLSTGTMAYTLRPPPAWKYGR